MNGVIKGRMVEYGSGSVRVLVLILLLCLSPSLNLDGTTSTLGVS